VKGNRRGAGVPDADWFRAGGSWRHGAVTLHVVRGEELVGDAPRHWSVRFEHPDSRYSHRWWRTDIGLTALDDGRCRVAFSTVHWLKPGYVGEEPPKPVPSAPSVVSKFVKSSAWHAHINDFRLQVLPVVIDALDVDTLLGLLRDPKRQFPIVYVSRSAAGLHLDSHRLAKLLVGSAVVVHADSIETDVALARLLPRKFSATGGMARVYLPEVKPDLRSDARRHRYFLRIHIQRLGATAVEELIINGLARRLLAPINSNVSSPEDVAAKDRLFRMAALRASLEAGGDKAGDLVLEELEYYKAEVDRLSEAMAELRPLQDDLEFVELEKQELADSLGELKSRNAKLQAGAAGATKVEVDLRKALAAARHLPELPSTVRSCCDRIHALFPTRVAFSPDALRAADASCCDKNIKYVQVAWKVLWACAADLWEVHFDPAPGENDPQAAFKDRSGFDMSLSEGSMTKKDPNLSALRKTILDGETYDITPHVKWGTHPPKLLRVHFAVDHKRKRLVIGHCGDHLKTAGTKRRGY